MALSATVYRLQIGLSDVDRGVYQELDLRLGRHPSESMAYLLTRVIAYCLCWEEGIAFSKGGLSSPDEPAISSRDLQGSLRLWIEIGTPTPERLHKASKASPRVVVFTQNDPDLLRRAMRGKTIHRAAEIEVYAVDSELLAALEAVTERNTHWSLTHNEGVLYVTCGDTNVSAPISRQSLLEFVLRT
ncbi:MAG TPA: YaeQ family protein [Vicinamibacterales bacterium]